MNTIPLDQPLTVGSLCSGYGGIELGLAQAGINHRLAFTADSDPAAATVLAHRFPTIPNLGNITTVDWQQAPKVDLLTAGFPCQDVSAAGRRQGMTAHSRSGLWSHVAQAVAVLRPPLVFIENVKGLLHARADSDVEPCPWCLGNRGGGTSRACTAGTRSCMRRPGRPRV